MREPDAEWREITTLDEFRETKKVGKGYTVITDTANPNRIHKPACPWVKEENFEEKVVKNRCKNGHYYWTDNLEFAQAKWQAKTDSTCI